MTTIYLVSVHYEDNNASEPRKAFTSKEKADAFVISEREIIDKRFLANPMWAVDYYFVVEEIPLEE